MAAGEDGRRRRGHGAAGRVGQWRPGGDDRAGPRPGDAVPRAAPQQAGARRRRRGGLGGAAGRRGECGPAGRRTGRIGPASPTGDRPPGRGPTQPIVLHGAAGADSGGSPITGSGGGTGGGSVARPRAAASRPLSFPYFVV